MIPERLMELQLLDSICSKYHAQDLNLMQYDIKRIESRRDELLKEFLEPYVI